MLPITALAFLIPAALAAPTKFGIGATLIHLGTAPRVARLGDGTPLRIMPVGASITWGLQSSDGNGYRDDLRSRLVAGGNAVNMVGSVKHGEMVDNDNEGWPGFVIDDVRTKADASAPGFKSNIYLVNVGTNDCARNVDIPNAGARLRQLVLDLFAASPRATVVISSLLINRNAATEANVGIVNQQYRALADQLRADGRRVVFAEMHANDGPQLDDLADDTHPTDAGYQKMAAIWYAAIVQASNEGLLQPADKVPGIPDDGGSAA